MPLSPGSHLGPYEVLALIGAGGMGEVYRARDPRLGREVAIKVLPHDRVADESRRQRFIREAKAASALNHPNIVTIHEIESANGIDFIVMEYVRGKSLDALIPRQGMRLNEALRIAIAVADAVTAAHARGIVHRDLKPANVMVGTDGAVKVLDFGLAKLLRSDAAPDEETVTHVADAGLSAPGIVVGTTAYMSPEQATGAAVDARSDIFSFGAMLYEMVTGHRAFARASTPETLAAVVRAQPKPPTELVASLPGELERVILRCLRTDPERRFQTARDLAIELQEIREESESARLVSAGGAVQSQRSHATVRVFIAAVLLVAAIGAWMLSRKTEAVLHPPTLVPLSALNGNEYHPTFSPDGEQVAFSWNGEKEDNFDIYLKLVGSSDLRRLTTDPSADAEPTWSPDGKQIAFFRDVPNGRAVYSVSPVTGIERRLGLATGEVHGLAWSSDSRWLALDQRGSGESNSIYVLPRDGGELRVFLQAKPPENDILPAFSPDGRQMAFTACPSPAECVLKVIAVDATPEVIGAPRTLATRVPEEACWTRDGRSLIYFAEGHLWRVPADNSAAPEIVTIAAAGVGQWPFGATVAQGRDRLAYVQERRSVSICPLDMTFTSRPLIASSLADFDAQFSPDGQRLAFESTRSGGSPEIWTARADGTGAQQLTRGPGVHQGSPAWSPDGLQIAFDSQSENKNWRLFVTDAAAGMPHQVDTGAGNANVPVWSRDGRWLYFSSDRNGRRNIWRVALSGGPAQQITTEGAGVHAVMAPDGTELFYAPTDGPAPLLAINANGGTAPREVLPCTNGYATSTTALYYIDCGPGPEYNVRVHDRRTSHDRVLGRTRTIRWTAALTVSPDGKTVLVLRDTHTTDLVLIENFR